MRILHVGDVHIREGDHLEDTVNCLAEVVDIAVDNDVDSILIPGDVFDRKSTPTEREVFRKWLNTLRHYTDADLIMCRGNHDAPNDLPIWRLGDSVDVFERPGWVNPALYSVLVLPWPERAWFAAAGHTGEGGMEAAQNALHDLIRTEVALHNPGTPLVVMGHLSVCGAVASSGQPLIGREIQVVAGVLEDLGASYVALNHIHKHQEVAKNVVYAGSLTRQDFGEEGEERGVVLVDIDPTGAASWEFIPVPARPWATVDAMTDEFGPVEFIGLDPGVDETFFAGCNVRYRYTCTEDEHHLFDHAAIERRFTGAHTLKIVPQIERQDRVRSAEVAAAKTPREKVIAWGAATGTEVSESALDKLEGLVGVREEWPS